MAKAKTKTKRKKPISTTRSAVVFTVLAPYVRLVLLLPFK